MIRMAARPLFALSVRAPSVRGLLAAAAVIAGTLTAVGPAQAADMSVASVNQLSGQTIQLGVNKSLVMDLPEDVSDVLVSNPAIADVVVRSQRTIYLIGLSIGETNVFLFGADGSRIAQFEVVVAQDTTGLQTMIPRLVPGADVTVSSVGGSVVLSGSVHSPEDASKVAQLAASSVGSADNVVNLLTVQGSDQVNLRVVVAEVQRDTARQLGINLSAVGSIGSVAFDTLTSPLSNIPGASSGVSASIGTGDFSTVINALSRNGLVRTLAEPNLTAVSGASADFHVGGQVPIATGIDQDTGQPIIEFKDYGVQLSFTPVVESSGRINLTISTEVSQIDPTVTVAGRPGFTTRQASTVVELPSGGSLAIGGLIQDNITQTISGVPGLMDLPILGTLFKSRDFQRSQSELVIFVTPYLVEPVSPSEITRPDQNFSPASDAQAIFLNQLNRIYRVPGAEPDGTYRGSVGFIYE